MSESRIAVDQPTERVEGQFYIDVGNKIRELEAKLGAERERYEGLLNISDQLSTEVAQLNVQLAAERERSEERHKAVVMLTERSLKAYDDIRELKEQLAAARKAPKKYRKSIKL